MLLNFHSIAFWSALVLIVIPVQAQGVANKHDVPTLVVTGSLAIPDISVPRAALSPDGNQLAAPLKNDRIALWNITSGEQEWVTYEGHNWQIFGMAFCPDGLRLATASWDKTAKLWDATTGKLLATMEGHDDRIEYLNVSPLGKYVFTSTGKTWPYEKYGPVEARIWNAKTGELVAELQGHTGTITRAEFSRDETRVLTASDDHTVRVWGATTGKELHKFDLGSRVMTAVYSHDNKTILASSRGHRNAYAVTEERQRADQRRTSQSVVKVWDATTGRELQNLPQPPFEHDPRHGWHGDVQAAFSKGGDQIITEQGGLITYWDTATGTKLTTLREVNVPSPTVIFSPKSDFLVVLNRKKHAELWSGSEKKKVREMEVPFCSDFWSMEGLRYFSADGNTFYSLDRGEFRWWSLNGIQ